MVKHLKDFRVSEFEGFRISEVKGFSLIIVFAGLSRQYVGIGSKISRFQDLKIPRFKDSTTEY